MSAPVTFRKSSQCDSGSCVEVSIGEQIVVRNSDNPERVVTFSAPEWSAFLAGVRVGDFDLNADAAFPA